jgi:hypothetical protein
LNRCEADQRVVVDDKNASTQLGLLVGALPHPHPHLLKSSLFSLPADFALLPACLDLWERAAPDRLWKSADVSVTCREERSHCKASLVRWPCSPTQRMV